MSQCFCGRLLLFRNNFFTISRPLRNQTLLDAEFLKPLNDVISKANAMTEGKRSEFFNHLKASVDSLSALAWIAFTEKGCGMSMPIAHIEESWQMAKFYSNKDFTNTGGSHTLGGANDQEDGSGDSEIHLGVESDSSEDEVAPRNTIGDVPLKWYEDEPHIGYDVKGKRILKREKQDKLHSFLASADDPSSWLV